MNKTISESSSESVDKGQVSVGTVGRRLPRKSWVRLLLVVAIIGLALGGYAYYVHKKQAINNAKVTALIKSDNCSDKAQNSVSSEKSDPNNVDASIQLLRYRSSCLVQQYKFSQAAPVLSQLKTYYQMKHDSTNVQEVNQEISQNSDSIAHPIKPSSDFKPELTPQEVNSLEKWKEQNGVR